MTALAATDTSLASIAAVYETPPQREALRWTVCAAVVLALHGGVAMGFISQQDRGDVGESSPVVVEFAALPVATAPLREVAPGVEQVQSEAAPLVQAKMPEVVKQIDVQETKPVRTAEVQPLRPVLDAKPTTVKESKPVEVKQVRPQQQDPDAVQELPQVEHAEVALASLAPPAPPVPVKEVKEEKPDELKTAVPVAPSVAVAVTTAPTSASINNATLVNWRSRIASHLQRYKRYPGDARARREQGVAQVAFTVDRSGKIVAAQIIKPSGSSALDSESLAMLRRAEPLPPPPRDIPGNNFAFTVPIQFTMR